MTDCKPYTPDEVGELFDRHCKCQLRDPVLRKEALLLFRRDNLKRPSDWRRPKEYYREWRLAHPNYGQRYAAKRAETRVRARVARLTTTLESLSSSIK